MEKQHDIAKRVVSWGLVVGWMMIIFLLSSRQSLSVSSEYVLNFLFFKFLHMVEYGILYALMLRALLPYQPRSQAVYAMAFFLTLIYAMTDELHQTYVPSREGKLRDVIIDGIGAGLLWYFLSIQLPGAPKRLKSLARSLGLIF